MLKNAPVIPYIPVRDLARARRFYEEKVGLEPGEEIAGGLVYRCGGAPIFMYVSQGAGTSRASQAFWSVDDVPAEVAALRARGVVFEDYDRPEVKTVDGMLPDRSAAWFKDSEGNIMAIIRR
jgi:catechol 2,3-dioxygenase-like lactoylglutathione lyase family enzyme